MFIPHRGRKLITVSATLTANGSVSVPYWGKQPLATTVTLIGGGGGGGGGCNWSGGNGYGGGGGGYSAQGTTTNTTLAEGVTYNITIGAAGTLGTGATANC